MSEDLNQIYCGRSLDMNTNPPSTLSTAPLTKFASSEARYKYAYATSFVSPRLRSGVFLS